MNIIKYLDRIKRVDKLIKMKSTGSPAQLAKKLDMSESSVYLLINNMKEIGAPIYYNSYRNTYEYYEECCLFLGYQIRELNTKEKVETDGGIYMVSLFKVAC